MAKPVFDVNAPAEDAADGAAGTAVSGEKPDFDPAAPSEETPAKPAFVPEAPSEDVRGGGASPEEDAPRRNGAETARLEEDALRAMAEKPRTPGRFITKEDVDQLSEAYAVDPEFLRKAAGWYGGRAYQESRLLPTTPTAFTDEAAAIGEHLLMGHDAGAAMADVTGEAAPSGGVSEMAKYNIGRALGQITADLPQNIVRKALAYFGKLSPDESDALVGLQQLIHNRRPWGEAALDLAGQLYAGAAAMPTKAAAVAEAGAPVASLLSRTVSGAADLVKHTATGAAIGAAYGAAGSKEGEELSHAAMDAMMGAGLSAASMPLIKGVSWLVGTREKAAQYVARRLVDEAGGADAVSSRMGEIASADAPAEDALKKVVYESGQKRLIEGRFIRGLSDAERGEIADLAHRVAGRSEERVGELRAAYVAANDQLTESRALERFRDETAFEYTQSAKARFTRLIRATGADIPSVEAAKESQGAEHIERVWDAFREGERLSRASQELAKENGRGDISVGPLFRMAKLFADDRAVLSAIDRRFPGLNVTPEGDLGAARFNAATNEVGREISLLDEIGSRYKKLSKQTADGREITPEILGDALNRGDFEGLAPDQKDWLHDLARWQEDARVSAEGFHEKYEGLDISPVKIARLQAGPEGTYMQNTVKDPVNFVLSLQERLDAVGGADTLLSRAQEAGSLAAKVKKGLEIWSGAPIESTEEMTAAVDSLRRIHLDGEALQTQASALQKRTGQIPDFLLEQDPLRAAARWVTSTYRHLAGRDMIMKYLTVADGLEKVSPILADHLTTMARDLSGVRRNTFAGSLRGLWLKAQLSLEKEARLADMAGHTTMSGALRTLGSMDRLYSNMTANMYRYFLGANVRTFAKNVVQPVVTTLPAMGATDPITAAQMMGKAYFQAAVEIATRRAKANLHLEGLRPSEHSFEANDWLTEGVRAGGKGMLRRAYDASAQSSMVLFDAADITNRSVTRALAHDIVETLAREAPALAEGGELSRHGKTAAEAIASAEPAYRDMILSQIRRGEVDEAKASMARYLNGATQYNYTRSAMSEYGRAMGSAFSMFTKWPSVAAGDMLSLVDAARMGDHNEASRRVLQAAWKYLAPLALSGIVYDAWTNRVQDDPRMNLILGKDPVSWTAADAARSLASYAGLTEHSDTMFPPAGEAVAKGFGKATSGDWRQAVDEIGEAAISGMPGSVWLRFVMKDAPALFMNRRMEGKTTMEKIHTMVSGPPG